MKMFRWVLLGMRNVWDKNCRENETIHFMFNISFRKSYRLWDNMEKYCRTRQATDETIIRRMSIACWITKVTDTLGVCSTYFFSAVTMFRRTHLYVTFIRILPVLLYIFLASIFLSSFYNLYFSVKIRYISYVQNSDGIQYFGKRITTE